MIDPNAKYITLSHCWGSSLPARLLQASYQQFCDHIPVSTLPRTFQDAIKFVRTLQIRFIWIDALCIVQDSKEDWLLESLQMASVYSYSWLNIAATSSADGHGGLFKTRNRLLPARCQVNASWTGHMPGLYICFDQSAWARRVEEGHLNTRGWVLQERLLAPRNVHFAYDQIWWECRETRACEAFPNGIPDYVLHLDTEKAKLLVNLDLKDPLGSNEQWLGIVKIYTQTHLTKDSDRLIALAGIVSTVQNTLKWPANDYHAGLWRYDLPVDLLWRMAAYGTRVKEYVAPSWSWASVKGEVYFNSSENRAIIRKYSLIEIRKVETSPISGPFGPVASGSIQVRGSLHKICLNNVEDSANGRYITKLEISGVALSEDNFAEGLDDEELYVRGLTHPLQAYFCRFATFETPHMDEKYSSEGLILEVVDQDQAVYQRIGWMRIFHDEYDGPFRGQNAGGDRYVFRIA